MTRSQTNGSTLVKLILFEKSRLELDSEFVFLIFTTRVWKHFGDPRMPLPQFCGSCTRSVRSTHHHLPRVLQLSDCRCSSAHGSSTPHRSVMVITRHPVENPNPCTHRTHSLKDTHPPIRVLPCLHCRGEKWKP